MRYLLGRIVSEQFSEFFSENCRRFEPPVGPKIQLEEAVGGARDVAAYGIQRLVFAPVAVRRARVQKKRPALSEAGGDGICIQREAGPCSRSEPGCFHSWNLVSNGMRGVQPRIPSAAENRSRLGIGEIVPAVADDPAGVIEMRGEIGYGNEGGVAHGMQNYE